MVIKVSAKMKKREKEERTDEDIIMGNTRREMTETRTQANELSVQKKR